LFHLKRVSQEEPDIRRNLHRLAVHPRKTQSIRPSARFFFSLVNLPAAAKPLMTMLNRLTRHRDVEPLCKVRNGMVLANFCLHLVLGPISRVSSN